ncbi:ABC transporter ATP-binding protein [Bacillus sp. FJAT-45350]|uniref:ABC transporter ATP-binding protein n=1 Tax=Bacillus sp. FJAT-45350 TaxID=2011014 RepID=UPI000BB843F2|nr:ABC transporter ATP-binding protein [Bacillus sp. FJAT-45350]
MKKYKWLFPYIKPYTPHLVVVLVISLVSTALSLSYPYFTSLLIDDVLINQTYSLKSIVFLAFGAMFAGYVLSSFNSLLYLHVTLQMLRNLRRDLFLRIQKTKYRFFVHRKVGDIITRLNGDAAEVQSGLTDTILQAIIQVSTFIFVASMLLWLDFKLALVCFLFMPVLIWAIVYFRPLIVSVTTDMRKQHSTLQSFLIERLNGIKLIKFVSAETRVTVEFDKQVKEINQKSFRYSLLSTLAEGIPRIAILLSTILVFSWGGHLVLTEQMTIGALVAFTGYQARLFGPVQSIAALYMRFQRMNVSLGRLEELVQQTEVEIYEKSGGNHSKVGENEPLLTLENVSFGYQQDKHLLHGANFKMDKGEVVAIVGPSGIGKSTFIDLITGLYQPTNGSIGFKGTNIEELSLSQLRAQIAVATQQAPLFNGSIFENIKFSQPNATLEEVKEVAELVGLHEDISTFEARYETLIGERGSALSGGQRQRIALARTLLQKADLYVLDEATSEVDIQSEKAIFKRLRNSGRTRNVIIISHRLSTLDWVDSTWVVQNGQLFRKEVGYEKETS